MGPRLFLSKIKGVMTLNINTIKYPKNPTSPIITSTAISEKYSQVIQPLEF